MPTTVEGVPRADSHYTSTSVLAYTASSRSVRDSISVDLTQLALVLDTIFASSSSSSSSTTSALRAIAAAQMAGVDGTLPKKHTDLQLAASSMQQPPISTKSNDAAVSKAVIMATTTSSSTEIVTHLTMLEWPVLEEYAIEYPEFPLIESNLLHPSHKDDFFLHRPSDEWYTLPPEARHLAAATAVAIPYNQSVDMRSVGVILYILICGYRPTMDDDQNVLFLQKVRLGE